MIEIHTITRVGELMAEINDEGEFSDDSRLAIPIVIIDGTQKYLVTIQEVPT
jgi:hypothetical protein